MLRASNLSCSSSYGTQANSQNELDPPNLSQNPVSANTEEVALQILNPYLPPDILRSFSSINPRVIRVCKSWYDALEVPEETLKSILAKAFEILGKPHELFVEKRLNNNEHFPHIECLKHKMYALLLDQQMALGIIQPKGSKFDLVLEHLHDNQHFPNLPYLKQKLLAFVLNHLKPSNAFETEDGPEAYEIYKSYLRLINPSEGMFDLSELYQSIQPENLQAHFKSFISSENYLKDSNLYNICAAKNSSIEYIGDDGKNTVPPLDFLLGDDDMSIKANQLRTWLTAAKVPHIVKIEARSSNISEIAPEICTLPLRELHLTCNKILEIPEALGSLTNLYTLDLNQNAIAELPQSFGNLKNLTSVNISTNQIKQLPDVFMELIRLESIVLADNTIEELPPSFSKLENLNRLDLSNNKIKVFPEVLKTLTCLINLNLNNNELTDVPSWIFEIPPLNALDLGGNSLSALPDLSKATNLEVLDISNNKFTEFPKEILNLKNLKTLILSGIPFKSIPKEIFTQFPGLLLIISENQIMRRVLIPNFDNIELSSGSGEDYSEGLESSENSENDFDPLAFLPDQREVKDASASSINSEDDDFDSQTGVKRPRSDGSDASEDAPAAKKQKPNSSSSSSEDGF